MGKKKSFRTEILPKLKSIGAEEKMTIALEEFSSLNNELINLQREISKKNSELLELNTIKNQFIGMVAHDLRNPISVINSCLEVLEDDKYNYNEEQRLFLNHIKNLSQFMFSLVNDLLTISNIEAGSITLQKKEIEMVKFLKDTIQLNRLLAEKKKITITFQSNIGMCSVQIDKNKIEQVMNNLISNAMKYSFENTKIFISFSVAVNEIVISVRDQGQGIPSGEIGKLFKPFQRTSVKATNNEDSTGLGLFIVKKIVEAHSGKIWCESKVGEGTSFFFTLPKI